LHENFKAKVDASLLAKWLPSSAYRKSDFDTWFTFWGGLVTDATKEVCGFPLKPCKDSLYSRTRIVPLKPNMDVEALRNCFAHCNYWNEKEQNDGTPVLESRTKANLSTQSQWLLWNIYKRDVKFCFVTKEEELRKILNKVETKCQEAVEKKHTYIVPSFKPLLIVFALLQLITCALFWCRS